MTLGLDQPLWLQLFNYDVVDNKVHNKCLPNIFIIYYFRMTPLLSNSLQESPTKTVASTMTSTPLLTPSQLSRRKRQ